MNYEFLTYPLAIYWSFHIKVLLNKTLANFKTKEEKLLKEKSIYKSIFNQLTVQNRALNIIWHRPYTKIF